MNSNITKIFNSFHEIGYYDYSAILNYVNTLTNSTGIIYIGHSQGSTASLVYASLRATEAKKLVKVFIPMAPTSIMKYTSTGTFSGAFMFLLVCYLTVLLITI